MYRELIVSSLPGLTRMALVEDGEVVELGVEHRTDQSVLHGIYRARIQRIVPASQAAFLDLGLRRNAFLQFDRMPAEALETGPPRARRTPGAKDAGASPAAAARETEELLQTGKPLAVQVTREPLGSKGYKVTWDLRLRGRFFDYRPLRPTRVFVPRETIGIRERVRITTLVERKATLAGEWIPRVAAEQREEDLLAADITRLEADWTGIRRDVLAGRPECLRAEAPMVFCHVRDVLASGFSVIRVDSEPLYVGLVNFVRQFLPGMEHKIRLYSRNYPIFEEYGVEASYSQAGRRRVRLPSGGSIVIDQTEALVAVDVNTGSYAGEGREREETNTATNLEAAIEVARQLRLRGLGGIIVVDFIDMRSGRNRDRVFKALQARLRQDPAFTRVSPPEPRAGLVIITRKRERASLESELLVACPACSGTGKVRSPAAACQQVLTRARKQAPRFSSGLVIRAAPGLAGALRRSGLLPELVTIVGGPVQVLDQPGLAEPRFELLSFDQAAEENGAADQAAAAEPELAPARLLADPHPTRSAAGTRPRG